MCDYDKIEDLELQIKDLEGKIGKIGDGLHRHIESPFPHSFSIFKLIRKFLKK